MAGSEKQVKVDQGQRGRMVGKNDRKMPHTKPELVRKVDPVAAAASAARH